MVKVKPSAPGFAIWNVKSLTKDWMLSGVLNQALPAWEVPPLVSWSRESARPVDPLNVMKFSALLKPFTKAEPVPLEADVYVAVATLLLVLPLAAAMALIVVVVLILSGAE